MDTLGHCLDVVDVPEEGRVTVVRCLVVGDWRVRVVASARTHLSAASAGVEVPLKCLTPQPFPPFRLVPCSPGLGVAAVLVPGLLSLHPTHQWLDGGDEGADGLEICHRIKSRPNPRTQRS